MSYDIDFRVEAKDAPGEFISVYDPDANITWNLRKMIEVSTGLPWINCEDNGLVSDVMPAIYKGWEKLNANPEQYRQYEAENGWGTVEGLSNFFETLICGWKAFQQENPQLAKIAHFWIV